MDEETVTITKREYDSLIKHSNFLHRLEANGVDNWVGYDDCLEDD